ncbi:MAG TPA: thioredoxin-like domain-containing protein [Bacteroidales bacterium]|nr:thioredoxin-like domain-containing protein [Bacteroidales bacterium]HPS15870.1 thioredoxin-like domain-containing protein [Bacteroidales bacterium]
MNLKKILSIIAICILSINAFSQNTVTGIFPSLAGQKIRLFGFEGFISTTIDSVVVSDKGIFKLNYSLKNNGMGYLVTKDNKAYYVLLSAEDIQLKGETFELPEKITILSGKENQLFEQYASEHAKREQALDAWIYLRNLYQSDSFFVKQKDTQQKIVNEIIRIKQEDNDFLKNLNTKSYVSWYLPLRKLVSSVSKIAQYRTEEIKTTLEAFRNIDYSDERLYKSGLLKDAIESHYWLLENMGQPLDTVFKEMNISTDCLIASLSKDEKKFNEITKYLFDLLETHSLFQASEYLAVKVLTQNSCTLNDNLANKLEMYRAMKIGNSAPNIIFTGDVVKKGNIENTTKNLSEIKSDYKVVIFGASWCPKCAEELGKLIPLYDKWKAKNVEVVFISLDTVKLTFNNFTSIFPFISMCDYKKWNSQPVKNYYVFASPTMFLLDKNQKIILRPESVKQIDAWVDFYIK